MDAADSLLGGFASGDIVPAAEVVPALKREQDSTDDFEHLDRESKRDEAGESPTHQHGAARTATQSFLDMERDDLFVDTPRAPSVTDKQADHFADKFTDSESEADTAGESPLHRPSPPQQKSDAPLEPSIIIPQPVHDPTPVLASTPASTATPPPTPAPVPSPSPVPSAPEAKVETRSEIKLETSTAPKDMLHPAPATESKPLQKPTPPPKSALTEPEPKPEVKSEPVKAPTAHVIEAEVIFCQMGLGKHNLSVIS
ncbi:unnamed protein product [Parnassius apollo]|uniref:(apollo) hypothetical protein n=1 Tax=Parnassius apollo TaxID=110799 RepID=A0A8S3WIV9_PARAO|nr:unnamed protein product [Parnassius apollo]